MSNFRNLLNFLHLDLLLSLLFPFTTGADAPLHGFLLDHFHCRPCLTMNQSRIIQGFPFKSPFPLFSLFLANPSDPKCLQLLIFRPGREFLSSWSRARGPAQVPGHPQGHGQLLYFSQRHWWKPCQNPELPQAIGIFISFQGSYRV